MKNTSGLDYAVLRSGLPWLTAKLSTNLPVTVAFLGGSITEGYAASDPDRTSWRALTELYLKQRYPDKSIAGINAGVGGTDSAFGAHRLGEHVLAQGEIDLLFVEFAVNDGEDRVQSVKGMEGIVRQMRRRSPQTDICFLYTAADKNLTEGMPFNIAVHEEVAEHYGIPSVNFAAGIRELLKTGSVRFEEILPDRTHPNDEGFALYAGFLRDVLDAALPARDDTDAGPASMPLPEPLEAGNYEFGRMLGLNAADASEWFTLKTSKPEPLINWRYELDHLYADAPGAELTFTIEGREAGVLLLHGPDSGIFEYSLDGGASFTPVNVFDEWCPVAYRPIPVSFPFQPERAVQHVTIRCTGTKDERSRGTGIRVMKLLSS